MASYMCVNLYHWIVHSFVLCVEVAKLILFPDVPPQSGKDNIERIT